MRRWLEAGLISTAVLAVAGPVSAAQPLNVVSGPSPFAAGCNGAPQSGNVFRNAEIEPYVDVNPANPRNLVTVYQQDRWSNGGANGNLTSVSFDGGATWTRPPLGAQPRFSYCAGGNAANGGDFERATDPWVSFDPHGNAFQASVSFNDSNVVQAQLLSKSTDGGRTWGPNVTLLRDTEPNISDERAAVTADFTRAGNVYVVWDRLVLPPAASPRGPTLLARSTDDGASFEPAREIYAPPPGQQTSGNQIVVMPDGDLLNFFEQFGVNTQDIHPRQNTIAVIRSRDHGATWSQPTIIARANVSGVTDPRDGATVRTGDVFPEVAADERRGRHNVYAAWEDTRFTGGQRHQIAFSRSTDDGRTWSTPVRVSANRATQAFVPSVDVNDRGDVAVGYYDFSADTPASPTLDTQYWLTRSSDAGRSWSRRRQITDGPFDMRAAPLSGGYFLGEYQGLESAGAAFEIAAAFANTGNTADPTDIYAATVRGGDEDQDDDDQG